MRLNKAKTMDYIKNIKSIDLSDATREFLTIKAELSWVYNHLANALCRIDARCDNFKTKELKDAFLDLDNKLLYYIADHMEEEMLVTEFRQL